MRKKLKFNWKDTDKRSVHEIVSEYGALRSKEIFPIIRQLCLLLEREHGTTRTGKKRYIHPKNVIVHENGSVHLSDHDLPLSFVEPYLPPEFDHGDPLSPRTIVYGLGMLMLFMATGKEKKTDIETEIGDRSLLSLIERSITFDPKARIGSARMLMEAIKEAGGSGKKAITVLFAFIFIALLVVLSFFLWDKGKTLGLTIGEKSGFNAGYAGGYEQGQADAPGIGVKGASFDAKNGNLPGNLSAAGGAFAVRNENRVYFLLEDTINEMDPYTKELRTLVENSGADSLHYFNGQLYYSTDERILRIDPKTMKEDVLWQSRAGQFYIFDGSLYLYDRDTLYLYEIDPDGKTLRQLNGAMEYLSLQIVDGKLYYIAPDRENSIYRCDLDGGNDTLISSNTYGSFCIYGDKLYAATEGGLIRMDLNGGNPERLTTQAAFCPNVTDGGIFYVSGNDRTLEWLSFDGRTRFTVVTNRTETFNIAGQWIFYRNMDDGGKLWRVRVNSADNARLTK